MALLPESSQDGVLGLSNVLLATLVAEEEMNAVAVGGQDLLGDPQRFADRIANKR